MKYLFVLFFITVLSINTSKLPDFKYLPATQQAQFTNGWHKYNSEGVIFDVEVLGGNLIQGNVKWLIDGTEYSGGLSNKGVNGKGTYKWPNGDKYEGSFSENTRHGKGTMYWSDGTKFIGSFKNNKRNGKGVLYDANGVVIEQGKWKDGILIVKKKKKKKKK